jgi:hypothetical protein
MSICYKCGVEEDYTDQSSTPQGAACWECYKTYHMTDDQRYESECFEQIRRIHDILDLSIKASEKIAMIQRDASWEEITKVHKRVEEEKEKIREPILAKLTLEERRILGI